MELQFFQTACVERKKKTPELNLTSNAFLSNSKKKIRWDLKLGSKIRTLGLDLCINKD